MSAVVRFHIFQLSVQKIIPDSIFGFRGSSVRFYSLEFGGIGRILREAAFNQNVLQAAVVLQALFVMSKM